MSSDRDKLPGLRSDLAKRFFEIKHRHAANKPLSHDDISFILDLVETGFDSAIEWMDEWVSEANRLHKPDNVKPSPN